MPNIVEEKLPLGAPTIYDTAPNMYCVYINKARQVARMGPGATTFEIPLVPKLTKGEVNRFVIEMHKLMPLAEIRVIHGADGVGIFALAVDPTYTPSTPVAESSSIDADVHNKRLWETCRDQADYLSRDTNGPERPGCSRGCRYFFPLAGVLSQKWGVCTEPRSPRAGLLTYGQMECSYFADEISTPPKGEENG